MLPRVPVIVIGMTLAMAFLLPANPAYGYWTGGGAGIGVASTGTLQEPTLVQVPSTSSGSVDVSWTASAGKPAPTGYYVTRTDGSTFSAACGSGPDAPILATSCVDTVENNGSYAYLVTAQFHSWTATSDTSGTVEVALATQLAFTTDPTDAVAGVAITPAVQVSVESDRGDAEPVPGITIALAIETNPAKGTLSGTVTANTDDAGVATFDDLSIDSAGKGYTLTASSDGLASATSATFTVRAPPLAGPALGRAASYSVLGTAATGDGLTTLSGDLGTYPAATAAGFPDGTVQGVIHTGDSAAAAAESDLTLAYADAASRKPDTEFAGDLSGVTFTAGVHHTDAALALSAAGTVTLDGQDNPDAVFIFQVDGALNTEAGSSVLLINGANAANVYWQVKGAAGTGAKSSFSGTILASGAITIGAGGTLIGRALSSGAVTLANNVIRFTVALPPSIAINVARQGSAITPSVSGTTSAAPGQTVTVTLFKQTLTTTVGPKGTWAVAAEAVPAGTYSVVARVRDAAGNAAVQTLSMTFK
jgi:hypothetical protein